MPESRERLMLLVLGFARKDGRVMEVEEGL